MRTCVFAAALCAFVLAAASTPADTLPARVRGIVQDAVTGTPVRGAYVVSGEAAAVTDSLGAFSLSARHDSLTVSHVGYEPQTLALTAAGLVRLYPAVLPGHEVVVRAGLTEQPLAAVPASITILEDNEIQDTGSAHLETLAGTVPNLNWAGGTSRPRYFQIRGIGERSHYAGGGPPSFTVGFVLDDVDLSGLGSAGLLFDLDQVEVFRGPQSTVFGPNSMAGLISLQSALPAGVLQGRISATAGTDAMMRVTGNVDLPATRNLAVRLGYAASHADGFRTNEYLQRTDTNRRREQVARLRALYAGRRAQLIATVFHTDLDNGYDVWAPDNNTDLRTYTDRQGEDSQSTTGFSLRAEAPLPPLGATLVSVSAHSRTRAVHSYDGDWGNDDFWAAPPYGFDPLEQGWRYDFYDHTRRQRTTSTQEFRLIRDGLLFSGDEAVTGVYAKLLEEEDDASGYLFGGDAADLLSTFDVRDLAVYAQYSLPLTAAWRLSANLRADHHRTRYEGLTDGGAERVDHQVDDWLTGGKAALHYQLNEARTVFASVSRGYRPGGLNQHPRLAAASRPYKPEYITSYEAGYRASGSRHTLTATLFYAQRTDQQVELSSQQTPGDPSTFVYHTANASSGRTGGLELEHSLRLRPSTRLFGSLGLLHTRVDSYTFLTEVDEEVTLGGRRAAYAPAYTFRLGGEYGRSSGLFARVETTGSDEFYFSQSHDGLAAAHQLLNGQAGYRGATWSITLWGRNLLDHRHAVRGFYFGLEPPDYPRRLYVTHGDPRHLGITVTASL